MNFSYNKLKESLTKKYASKLDRKSIDQLLKFEQGILIDRFPNKRLSIKKINFIGTKRLGTSSSSIDFKSRFEKGTNLILADNLKGKSSVFRIIKLALTGDSDLAKDIKSWIQKIYLEFQINDQFYTSYITLEKGKFNSGILFRLTIEELIDKEIDSRLIVFSSDSMTSYKAHIQYFFFKEFEFYNLKWTQKSSKKDSNELLESNATWNTYFESIYLSSRDSYKLTYGNQEELIFQMLLGLKLTYPINRLKVKYDKILNEISKVKDAAIREGQRKGANNKEIETELKNIQAEIDKVKNREISQANLTDLYAKRASIVEQISSYNKMLIENERQLADVKKRELRLQSDSDEKRAQIRKYRERIVKAKKAKNDFAEYLEFGIFFANLDISVCPHCNTAVGPDKFKQEKETKHCLLCNSELNKNVQLDKTNYERKITSLDAEIIGFEGEVGLLEKNLEQTESEIKSLVHNAKQLDESKLEITNLSSPLFKEVEALDAQIEQVKNSQEAKDLLELEKKRAVLEFRLNAVSNEVAPNYRKEISDLEAKQELLEEALQELKNQRSKHNAEILINFKDLMLEELTELGIKGISEIHLSDSFKASYNINGNFVGFDDISEGEQLRVKLAFYLSIIQCDIKYSAGKHPRLLIIDSPAKSYN